MPLRHEPAIAMFRQAIEFQRAAETLLLGAETGAVLLPFLYVVHHAIELYLKAFILLHSPTEPIRIHDIVHLFDRSVELGLKPSDPVARGSIVMLSSADEKNNLRYFDMAKRLTIPSFVALISLLHALRSDIEPFVARPDKVARKGS